jgi:hypothetical protein
VGTLDPLKMGWERKLGEQIEGKEDDIIMERIDRRWKCECINVPINEDHKVKK